MFVVVNLVCDCIYYSVSCDYFYCCFYYIVVWILIALLYWLTEQYVVACDCDTNLMIVKSLQPTYTVKKHITYKTSTRLPFWRWINFLHRTWAWSWNAMFFFGVSVWCQVVWQIFQYCALWKCVFPEHHSLSSEHSRTLVEQNSHRPQTLPPGVATWGVTLSTCHFLVAVYAGMCKHDVINIQHTTAA